MRLILALVIGLCMGQVARADVPANRLVTLSRGVNLIDVFANKSTADLRDEIAGVHRAGFRHIRFFIDPAWVWRSGEPQQLDEVIKAAFAVKLGVIICMQSYEKPLRDDQKQIDAWSTAWRTIATHYAATDPNLMFFELVNEPTFDNDAHWNRVQEAMRAQVRAIVPQHTLLLTGSPTSTSVALTQLTPSADDNVAYVFHLYAPMVFTHQGADWAGPEYAATRGLQYPPSYPNLTIIQNRAPLSLKADLAAYGMLGRDVIARNIQPALDWSHRYQKHLVVTEFGVYRAFAPAASRAAWLHDARTALEKDGIGWTLWEYNGGFGIKSDIDLGCGPLPIALGLCQPPP